MRAWLRNWGALTVVGLIIGGILAHLVPEFASLPESLHVRIAASLPVIRVLVVLSCLLWLWAAVLYVCELVGINVRNALRPAPAYPKRICSLPGVRAPIEPLPDALSSPPPASLRPINSPNESSPLLSSPNKSNGYHALSPAGRSRHAMFPSPAHPPLSPVSGKCATCRTTCSPVSTHPPGGLCAKSVTTAAAWTTCFVLVVWLVHDEMTIATLRRASDSVVAKVYVAIHTFFLGYNTRGSDGLPLADPVPLLLLAALVVVLVLPFHIALPHARWGLLVALFDTAVAPFGQVRFSDTFFADQLTSLSNSLADVVYSVCFYEEGARTTAASVKASVLEMEGPHATCNAFTYAVKYPVVVVPYVWRLAQCLRLHFHPTGGGVVRIPLLLPILWPAVVALRAVSGWNVFSRALARAALVDVPIVVNLVNAGKYSAFVFVQVAAWGYAHGVWAKGVLMGVSVVAQLYAFAWDILFDWGFERELRRWGGRARGRCTAQWLGGRRVGDDEDGFVYNAVGDGGAAAQRNERRAGGGGGAVKPGRVWSGVGPDAFLAAGIPPPAGPSTSSPPLSPLPLSQLPSFPLSPPIVSPNAGACNVVHLRRLKLRRLGRIGQWCIYITCAVVDLILRNLFLFSSAAGALVPLNLLRDETLVTLMVFAEVGRRAMWNVLRLENADVVRLDESPGKTKRFGGGGVKGDWGGEAVESDEEELGKSGNVGSVGVTKTDERDGAVGYSYVGETDEWGGVRRERPNGNGVGGRDREVGGDGLEVGVCGGALQGTGQTRIKEGEAVRVERSVSISLSPSESRGDGDGGDDGVRTRRDLSGLYEGEKVGEWTDDEEASTECDRERERLGVGA